MLIREGMLKEKTIYQKLYKFSNGYGASVVIDTQLQTIKLHDGSSYTYGKTYGSEKGLFELAVLKFREDTDAYELCYDTPITEDVEGHLTQDDVDALLKKISKLKKVKYYD